MGHLGDLRSLLPTTVTPAASLLGTSCEIPETGMKSSFQNWRSLKEAVNYCRFVTLDNMLAMEPRSP